MSPWTALGRGRVPAVTWRTMIGWSTHYHRGVKPHRIWTLRSTIILSLSNQYHYFYSVLFSFKNTLLLLIKFSENKVPISPALLHLRLAKTHEVASGMFDYFSYCNSYVFWYLINISSSYSFSLRTEATSIFLQFSREETFKESL